MCVNISLRAHIVKSVHRRQSPLQDFAWPAHVPGPFIGAAASSSVVGMGGRQDAIRSLT